MKARRRLVKVRLKPPVVEVVRPPPPVVVVEEGGRLRLGETEAGERPAGAEMGAETGAAGARKVSSHLSSNTQEIIVMFLYQNLPRPQTRPPGRRARSRRGRSAWPTRPSAAAASRAASALWYKELILDIGILILWHEFCFRIWLTLKRIVMTFTKDLANG